MHSISRFLPDGYDPSAPVALVAGRRLYPILLARSMRSAGVPVRLIAFEGETADELWDSFADSDRARIKVGQLGHMLKSMKKLGAKYAVMAGQIAPGHLFRELHPDLKALAILATLRERNAETIFGAICREIADIGITLLDARSFMDTEMASPGVMTGSRLKADLDSIGFGIRIAKEVARLDIGQGVVVRKGTVLAVEAFEGTDDMLSRANKYKTDGLIFVKTPKPRQDWRFDVPVFGMQTVESMKAAGIATACLEIDGAIILEKEAVCAHARKLGIELYGYKPDQAAAEKVRS
ncbi:MAG TPA: UDP-2,3-diacylglucosamine diphosphatase LpxI [Opitutales bacterium]|nr:UDP-2,3-diacylglucosamine diphosphatase LpxI [Opitutales bacterium]